jgi:hypothetical protein
MTIALSPVEAEQLRDLRARLNRVPRGAMGDKSVGPLSKGFFVVCNRVGLSPQSGGQPLATLPEMKAALAEGDLIRVKQIVAQLEGLKGSVDPKVWRQIFDSGVLSAVLTRRLVLGGRENV